jgi:hypothetical protein
MILVRGSMFRVPGSGTLNLELRTPNSELRTGTANTNLETVNREL